MYVCICNGYRDDEIREIAESGLQCAREVYLALGNGPCCGTCLDCAQGIVDGVHGRRRAEPPADAECGEALMMAAE
ncbi:MAG: bacterioferritin-associated ferredoxin [Kiloniellaceae bacterium]